MRLCLHFGSVTDGRAGSESRIDWIFQEPPRHTSMALPNPTRQQAARATLRELFAFPATVYAIHYACQSFYQDSQVASPRIGAVAVRQLSTGQVTSFSIAQVAELNQLESADIPDRLDRIEARLLDGFYAFVRENRQARFIHWNMRDQQFGFAAIEHRAGVLGRTAIEIPEANRFDLAQIVEDLYGADYVKGRAKMGLLAERNGLVTETFLAGRREADAFSDGRYREVANSTQAKVRVIADIATKANDRTLKTDASFLVQHAGPLRLMLEKVIDNPIPSVMATCAGAFIFMLKVLDYLHAR